MHSKPLPGCSQIICNQVNRPSLLLTWSSSFISFPSSFPTSWSPPPSPRPHSCSFSHLLISFTFKSTHLCRHNLQCSMKPREPDSSLKLPFYCQFIPFFSYTERWMSINDDYDHHWSLIRSDTLKRTRESIFMILKSVILFYVLFLQVTFGRGRSRPQVQWREEVQSVNHSCFQSSNKTVNDGFQSAVFTHTDPSQWKPQNILTQSQKHTHTVLLWN